MRGNAPRPAFAALLLALAAALPARAQAPVAVVPIAVASAANFEPGLPPRGSIAAIFCSGLLNLSGTATANQVPLPLKLNGVSVLIGGVYAPLFGVADLGSYQQIDLQVPNEAAPRPDGSYDLTIL